MKLYEISERFKNLEELLENTDLQIDDIKEALNEVGIEFEEKVEGIVRLIKNIEGDAEKIKSEEKRLAEKRKSLESKVTYLKGYIDLNMKLVGKKKIDTGLFKLSIQKNAPSINIKSAADIPSEYFIEQEPVLDKRALLKDLKEGREVPGVEMKQTESLRIR